MLDQEDDPKLNDEWLTADEQLTRFSNAVANIVYMIQDRDYDSKGEVSNQD